MDSAVSAALSAALGTIQQGNNAPKIMHPSSSGSTPPSGTPPASSSVSHGPSGSGTVGKASSPDSALNIAQKTAVAQAAGPVPTVTTSVSGVQNPFPHVTLTPSFESNDATTSQAMGSNPTLSSIQSVGSNNLKATLELLVNAIKHPKPQELNPTRPNSNSSILEAMQQSTSNHDGPRAPPPISSPLPKSPLFNTPSQQLHNALMMHTNGGPSSSTANLLNAMQSPGKLTNPGLGFPSMFGPKLMNFPSMAAGPLGPGMTASGLDTNVRSSSKVHHNCRVCGKEFRASSLDIHMRTHVGAKPFRCDRCPHRASQKGNLKMHMKKHHGVELPHHLDALPDAGIWCLMKPETGPSPTGPPGPVDPLNPSPPAASPTPDITGPRRGVIPESELLEQKVVRVIRRIQNKFGQASLTRPSDSLEDFMKLAEEALGRDGMGMEEAMRSPSPPIVVIQQSANGNEGRSRGPNKKTLAKEEDAAGFLSFPRLAPPASINNRLKLTAQRTGTGSIKIKSEPLFDRSIFAKSLNALPQPVHFPPIGMPRNMPGPSHLNAPGLGSSIPTSIFNSIDAYGNMGKKETTEKPNIRHNNDQPQQSLPDFLKSLSPTTKINIPHHGLPTTDMAKQLAKLANQAKQPQKIATSPLAAHNNPLNGFMKRPAHQGVPPYTVRDDRPQGLLSPGVPPMNLAEMSKPTPPQPVDSALIVWQRLNMALEALMQFYHVKSTPGSVNSAGMGPFTDLLPGGLTRRQLMGQIALQLGIQHRQLPLNNSESVKPQMPQGGVMTGQGPPKKMRLDSLPVTSSGMTMAQLTQSQFNPSPPSFLCETNTVRETGSPDAMTLLLQQLGKGVKRRASSPPPVSEHGQGELRIIDDDSPHAASPQIKEQTSNHASKHSPDSAGFNQATVSDCSPNNTGSTVIGTQEPVPNEDEDVDIQQEVLHSMI